MDKIVTRALTSPENRNKHVVQLNSADLKASIDEPLVGTLMPASFAVVVSVFGREGEEPILKLNGCYGPSSAKFLGRFAHLNNDLRRHLSELLRKEELHSPDAIFAEIAHLPEGRSGNVIARPHLRQYEIVYLADSSLDEEFQIPIRDLYVWVEKDQIRLWSKRLRREVVPRLSCAHNYSTRSLGVYRFLCMIQGQDGSAPGFSLPPGQSGAVFVPRVMLDNLILSEKTWRIPRSELVDVIEGSEVDREKVAALESKYQLDEYVTYSVVDNTLLLNLRNSLMLAVLLDETRNQHTIELREALACQYQTPVTTSGGPYFCNDVVIPMFNSQARRHEIQGDDPQRHIEARSISRRFTVGTEWASLKLYSGHETAESILIGEIYPFIHSLRPNLAKWFFVRYGDPEWHLRIRFHGNPNWLCEQLLPAISKLLSPLVESGVIGKLEYSTYDREIERYGGPDSIEVVESMFMADSELAIRLIQLSAQRSKDDFRWRAAILATCDLLDRFHCTEEERFEIVSRLRNSFGGEFNDSNMLRRQLGERFREVKHVLEDDARRFLDGVRSDESDEQRELFPILETWQAETSPLIEGITRLIMREDGLSCSRETLLYSLIHMHHNRMFRAYSREQEFVMHDFLRRLLAHRLRDPSSFR